MNILDRPTPLSVIRDLFLLLVVVCLIPVGILLIGAPVVLFVRLLLEIAKRVF